MINVLTTGDIKDEERSGWSMKCPQCGEDVLYTVLKINSGEDIYMYCDQCSNFTLREEDRLSNQLFAEQKGYSLIEKLRNHYKKLEQELPKCECGGSFRVWSNVRCPHCSYEFPYNDGIKDEEVRFFEGTIIWIEKAIAFRGGTRPSNKLRKVKK